MPFTANVFSLLWNFGSGTPPNSNNFPVQLGEDLTDIASGLTTLGSGHSISGAPTGANLAPGFWGVFKDTGGGTVVIAYNDGGTIKTATLT